ncbi:MAG: hypothetical protein OHK93_004256 [Ramalina farinacea]|uniref:Uncharacterized protein n=1 Tax=Ramalina farinacea TaxID=258253 RepID=A0AA43QGE2_9LECA|nr:hypothetical protein [Ramalina farinacea]
MSQSTIPRTPTPESLMERDETGIAGAMTPPPSSQMPVWKSSAPPITSGTLYGEVPSLQEVARMNEDELRSLASELVAALREARVTAAHSKLQHNLLSIESEESIKRAEVEHEATRREVQVLQEGSPVPSMASPQASAQRNLHLALSHCRDLQNENAILEKRLRSSKKIIARLDSHNSELKDLNEMLRQRIKDNRDHFNDLQESGTILTATPQQDYSLHHTKSTPRTPANTGRHRTMASQDPFDALLQAANLNGETNSSPSSPSQSRARRLHPGHLRGAHSLSSLPTTPERRPVTADALATPGDRFPGPSNLSSSAPGTQLVYTDTRARDDRESTISASEHDGDDYQQDDPLGSQASQMASSMLKRTLESQKSQGSPSKRPANVTRPAAAHQSKLTGRITKPSTQAMTDSSPKRKGGGDVHEGGAASPSKRARPGKIGLGIKTWGSPANL